MDQERDTTDNARSSRRGRIWLEAESLPTLFELPDRTPEALRRKRGSNQFTFHNEHAGPPASHVDPPSGNHSNLAHSGPTSPQSSDSATPDNLADSEPSPPNELPTSFDPPPIADKVAAYHKDHSEHPSGKSSSWSDDTRASWMSRSAIVMSVLAMITLAFFSGRGLRQFGGPAAASSQGDREADDLGETVVMITEDFTPGEHSPPIDSPALASDATAPPHDRRPVSDGVANTGDLPSYLTDPPPAGSLGSPSVASESANPISPDTSIADASSGETPGIPPAISPLDAVVAFRAEDKTSGDETAGDKTAGADHLPTGMDSRLRLEEGLRYSDTPHAIGNFLELLKAWETSEQ